MPKRRVILPFTESRTYHIKKTWGHECVLVNLARYCGKLLTLENTSASSVHFHALKMETFVAMRGEFRLELYPVYSGSTSKLPAEYSEKPLTVLRIGSWAKRVVTIPPRVPHRFYVGSDAVRSKLPVSFLEISSHDDPADSYRLVKPGLVCHDLKG